MAVTNMRIEKKLPERPKVSEHGFGIRGRHSKRRHRRVRRTAGARDSRRQQPDKLSIAAGRRPGNPRLHDRPVRRRIRGSQLRRTAHQPPPPVGVTMLVPRSVTEFAHRYVLYDVFAAFDERLTTRVGGSLRVAALFPLRVYWEQSDRES
jgi:hypothetical protein